MAPKLPKKPQLIEKSKKKKLEKPVAKSVGKKKSYTSFSMYIYKVLRDMRQDMGISRKSMIILNDFIYDMLERLATQAGNLVYKQKKNTMASSDFQAAVKLLLPGELAKHANAESIRAINKYYVSKQNNESMKE